MEICLRPVGYVEIGIPKTGFVDKFSFVSTIKIYDEFIEGLKGLDEYSHAFVLWYFHEAPPPRLVVRPWRREDMPEVGIFATRYSPRPNPIALTIVKLVEIDPPKIKVMGLDAWSGSPILDIKPYDHLDVVNEFRVPDWFEEFFRERMGEIPQWLGPKRLNQR
ncbi:MAG: tRNA (N6-threonylcarbamoyladenosine(37)-N6)-methyltransferase TrmO [Pyrobaculum sp.]